jgi:hypothetical protein
MWSCRKHCPKVLSQCLFLITPRSDLALSSPLLGNREFLARNSNRETDVSDNSGQEAL